MKPLEGIRILDLTQFLSGPFCTLTLHDLGAEVIKIEKPGTGDSTRTDTPTRGTTSAMYISCNRGKKSVELNLKEEKQKQLFLELVKVSDVVVENFKPGTMKKLGLDYEQLKLVKPDLIYLAISGYGQTGPYSARGALDIAIQAMSGFMSVTGERGGKPTKSGTSLADVVAGLYGVIGVLSALTYRQRTGEGQFVDVAMLDAMAGSIMQNAIARYRLSGVVPHPQGNRHPASSPFQEFATKDGSIMVCCPTNAQFKSLMEGLGHMEIYNDPRFTDTHERYANKDLLEQELNPLFAAQTTKEIADMMAGRGLAFGEINHVDDVADNEQLSARNMYIDVVDDKEGLFHTVGFPVKMDCVTVEKEQKAPWLGENTYEVFSSILGMEDEAIREAFN